MAAIIRDKGVGLEEKVALMREDARFDVSDSEADGPDLSFLRRNIRSKAPPPTVPKVFLSNDCVFNCAYCGCRSGNECKRSYQSAPRELAELAVGEAEAARRGIFITSAIFRNPDYTEELIVETLRIIRRELRFGGYVHAKVMPGTDPELIRRAGTYANRLSVNIEVARSEGYSLIARNKTKGNILTPMAQICRQIREAKDGRAKFATSQTTQLMAGSTGEDDQTILRLSGALYRKYGLSRVYYTAFQYRNPAAGYEGLEPRSEPQWRMKRLYQADRLMQLYGFSAEEIAPAEDPNLSPDLDPKTAWALRNIHLFPVEVNKSDYETLLRVPGIGPVYARRIVEARRYCSLTHETLRALGVSLRRSGHFLTCKGRFRGNSSGDAAALRPFLLDPLDLEGRQLTFAV